MIGRHPLTLADAAHNPMGCRPPPWRLRESFTYDRLVAVLAIMGDKDIDAMLQTLRAVVDEVVVTVNDSPRCLPSSELAAHATRFWTADQIHGSLISPMPWWRRDLAGPTGCVVAMGSV